MSVPSYADEKFAQPVDRVEIEMVRRLVEQQRLRVSEERLGQQHADFLPALQLRHLARVQPVGNIQPLQQDSGIALRGVPVLLAYHSFELAQAHPVGVGQRGLGGETVTLFEGAPQPLVAHDDGVDHTEAVERELVLAQHTQLGRRGDGALLRWEVARQQVQERRLASSVRARQPVAPAGRERGRDFVEEQLRPEPHGDVVDRNHVRNQLSYRE